MIIAPYKSNYFQVDPMVLENIVDNLTWDIDEEIILFTPKEVDGDKKIYFTALISACLINDEKLVDYILIKGANVHVGVDYYGNSCAHIAIQYGNLNILRKLIDFGADIEDRKSWQKVPLLHTAVYRKNYEITKYLIELGADVNAPSHGTFKGITPLITAVELKSKDIVKLLIENGAKKICPAILEDTHQQYRLLSPIEFFNYNRCTKTFEFNYNLIEQSTIMILPSDIKAYYFQRFLNMGVGTGKLTYNKSKYQQYLIKMILLLKSSSDDYSADVLRFDKLIRKEKYRSFRVQCEEEINFMNTIPFVGTNLSWCSAMEMTEPELAIECINSSVYYDIDELEQIFPLYGGFIFYCLAQGYYRIDLYESDCLKPKL